MTAPGAPPDPTQSQMAPVSPGRGGAPLPDARRNAILVERARLIAESRQKKREQELVVVAFRVGGERYAIRAEEVIQVLEMKGLSGLIGAPRWLLGAMMARSRLIPVLDLRHLIGLEGGGLSDLTRVLVIEENGDLFGVGVESIESQFSIPMSELAKPPGGPFRFIGPGRLGVLDLSKLEVTDPGRG